jgi:hypothetical protein
VWHFLLRDLLPCGTHESSTVDSIHQDLYPRICSLVFNNYHTECPHHCAGKEANGRKWWKREEEERCLDMSRKKWNNGAMWMMSKQINPSIMFLWVLDGSEYEYSVDSCLVFATVLSCICAMDDAIQRRTVRNERLEFLWDCGLSLLSPMPGCLGFLRCGTIYLSILGFIQPLTDYWRLTIIRWHIWQVKVLFYLRGMFRLILRLTSDSPSN